MGAISLETMESERQETVDELSDLFFVVQDMGRRLGNETHGPAYAEVRELNELLHQVRLQLNLIKKSPSARRDEDGLPQWSGRGARRS